VKKNSAGSTSSEIWFVIIRQRLPSFLSTHEDIRRRSQTELPSDRSFAFAWALFLLVVGLWPLWKNLSPRPWVLLLGGLFAGIAWLRPSLLHGPNRLWFAFGLLIAHFVTPIIAGVMFYGLFTPMAVIMRLFRRDPLRLRWDPDAESYWINRKPPGPPSETMTNQF
jgi:hypothetical protein